VIEEWLQVQQGSLKVRSVQEATTPEGEQAK
jgi:hypothetical protein